MSSDDMQKFSPSWVHPQPWRSACDFVSHARHPHTYLTPTQTLSKTYKRCFLLVQTCYSTSKVVIYGFFERYFIYCVVAAWHISPAISHALKAETHDYS